MFSRQIQVAIVAAMCILSGSGIFVEGVDINSNSMLGLLDMKAETAGKTLVHKYLLGNPNRKQALVQVYSRDAPVLSKRDLKRDAEGRIIVDLTPSKCTSQTCYNGAFQPPVKADCDAIVEAQLYNSTGSLRAFPGTFVYVTVGTCAVVFQNPRMNASYTLDYNWALLGSVVQNIQNTCLESQQQPSIGGICEIKKYLTYVLDSVGISLQRIAQT